MTIASPTRIRTPPEVRSTSLSPNQRRLLEGVRRLGFGTIRRLHIRNGDPIFDPAPEVVGVHRTVNPSEPSKSTPESFILSAEQQTLLRHLTRLGNGVVELIKVHDGLPVQLEIPESI